jgi:predicted dehydrogenase
MKNIGIIGAQDIIEKYQIKIKDCANLKLQGVYLTDQELQEKEQNVVNENVFNSFDLLMEQIDILFIVSPVQSEFKIAESALIKSRHVFIAHQSEITSHQAIKLVNIAFEKELFIYFGLISKFNPAYQTVKSNIQEPSFIEVHNLIQFPYANKENSVIMDLMAQDIDIILKHVNSKVSRISANGVSVISDNPDIATARIEFENGSVANITSSRVSMKKLHKIRFFQDNTYVSIDFDADQVEIVRISDYIKDEEDPFAMIVEVGKDKGFKKISFDKPSIKPIDVIKSELDNLLNVINDSKILENQMNILKKNLSIANQINEIINKH